MRLGPVLVLLSSVQALASNVLIVPSDEARSLGLSDSVVDVLTTAEVPLKVAGPKAPAIACTRQLDAKERRTCLTEFATRANASTVLFIGAVEQKKVVVGTLELLSQASGKLLKSFTVKAPAAKWAKQAAAQLKPVKGLVASQKFVAREVPAPVVESLEETPPIKEEPKAEPEPVKPEPVAEARPQPERSDRPTAVVLTPSEERTDVTETGDSGHPAAWTATGITIAAAAVAATIGFIGLSSKSRLESVPTGISTQSHSQAVALQGAANTQLTVALIVGAVAVVSGTTAGVLWGLEK